MEFVDEIQRRDALNEPDTSDMTTTCARRQHRFGSVLKILLGYGTMVVRYTWGNNEQGRDKNLVQHAHLFQKMKMTQ